MTRFDVSRRAAAGALVFSAVATFSVLALLGVFTLPIAASASPVPTASASELAARTDARTPRTTTTLAPTTTSTTTTTTTSTTTTSTTTSTTTTTTLAPTTTTTLAPTTTTTVAAPSTAPAYSGDFPDPFVLVVGGTYWAYSTGSAGLNLQVMSSPDLDTGWTTPSDPLPTLPTWATTGSTWAPGVLQKGATFLMYYTVHDAALGRQCISVASASNPGGPFVDTSSGPLVCQSPGSIDPYPFVDPRSGSTYLLWKSDDNSVGQITHLWASRLAANGLSLTGGTALLLTESASSWQAPAIEGPAVMLASGTNTYYLFYGAGNWQSAAAGIGYATCSAPSSGFFGLRWACQDQSGSAPWLGSRTVGGATVFSGPSGPTVFTDTSETLHLGYHAWTGTKVGYGNGGVRSLWIDTLSFSAGRPVLS